MSIDVLNGLTNPYINTNLNSFSQSITKSQNLQRKVQNKDVEDKELMNACKTFEGYFLQMMYKSMRSTVDTSSSFMPQSNAEKIFQDMLDEENSKKAAESGNGIGLAQMLYKQLYRDKVNSVNYISNVNSEINS